MTAPTYGARRRALLAAAAWNGYVVRRGIETEAALAARRENQVAMARLRATRKAVAA